jgi:hypothetical protein
MVIKNQIFRPPLSTYIAMLNVSPILWVSFFVIALQSRSGDSFIILLLLTLYIGSVVFVIKSTYIIIEAEKITIHRLFNRRQVIELSKILSKKEKYMVSKALPNRIELSVFDDVGKIKEICIRTKWFRKEDVKILLTVIAGK